MKLFQVPINTRELSNRNMVLEVIREEIEFVNRFERRVVKTLG